MSFDKDELLELVNKFIADVKAHKKNATNVKEHNRYTSVINESYKVKSLIIKED